MQTGPDSPPQSDCQPAVTVIELTDPATSGETLEVADWDLVKLASPGLRARRVIVRLEGGMVVYHRTNLRLRTRTTMIPGLWATERAAREGFGEWPAPAAWHDVGGRGRGRDRIRRRTRIRERVRGVHAG